MNGDSASRPVLSELARHIFPGASLKLEKQQGDGSARQIYRITASTSPKPLAAGIYHQNIKENEDFLTVTAAMAKLDIPVPEVYAVAPDHYCYLLEYLGDYNLAEMIDQWQAAGTPEKIITAYQRVIDWMPKIQFSLPKQLTTFLQNRTMGPETYRQDLRYWQQNFLNLFGFQDQFTPELQNELEEHLLRPLDNIPTDSFVYRDFQSRNFMWRDDQPVFIDYQSAFLGPFYYDPASMLFASRSGLNTEQRLYLIEYYQRVVQPAVPRDEFMTNLFRFVLLRRLRSLGSYGYLGLKQGKTRFLKAIPATLQELTTLLKEQPVLQNFSQLTEHLTKIAGQWLQRSMRNN